MLELMCMCVCVCDTCKRVNGCACAGRRPLGLVSGHGCPCTITVQLLVNLRPLDSVFLAVDVGSQASLDVTFPHLCVGHAALWSLDCFVCLYHAIVPVPVVSV